MSRWSWSARVTDGLAIADVVPHRGDLSLLDRIVSAGADELVCELTVRDDGLFDEAGSVSAMLGIEYMAQAVSAFSGLQRAGRDIKIGLLLGTRKFQTNVSSFPCGTSLRVTVHPLVQGKDSVVVFDCAVEGPGIKQSARVKAYEPEDFAAYLKTTGWQAG